MDKQTAIDLLDNLLGMVEDNHDSDYDTAIKMGIDAIKEKIQLSKEDATKGTTFDCISRQAAIDALNKMKIYRPLDSDRYVISDCLNKIVNLPSAQPEHTETHSCDYQRTETHEWIPVSKALPEDGVTVWVTIRGHDVIKCEDGETLEQAIARISKNRWVTQGYWSEEGHGWNDPSFGCPLMVKPIAWMPMEVPEPWRGGQDENDRC